MKLSFLELARASGQRFKVVANLPYNISGPIVIRFIEQRSVFSQMTLMFQKEVALRLAASPGTKDYGALSVLAQTYMDIRLEFDVRPGSFFPPPKVLSSVVSMVVRDSPGRAGGGRGYLRKGRKGGLCVQKKDAPQFIKGGA